MSMQRRKRTLPTSLFWLQAALLLVTFICWIGIWFRQFPRQLDQVARIGFPFLLIAIVLLGVVLLVSTIRQRKVLPSERINNWFLITGATSTAAGGGILLHNLFEALAELVGGWVVVSWIAAAMSVAFFFVGIIAPFLFLASVVATTYFLLVRRNRPKHS